MTMHAPLHPGSIVKNILIEGADLNVTDAAKHLGVSRSTLSRLLNGHLGISSEMAIRLSKLLENSDTFFWMNLQRDYDLWVAEKRVNKMPVIPLKEVA